MSQAKVEQYKKDKANRKKIMAKEKIQRRIGQTVAAVLCVVVVGWAGTSFYKIYENNQPVETYEANINALSDYITTVSY